MRFSLSFLLTLLPFLTFAQSTNGLIAHWQFNGNANDNTGKGHNGVMNNVTFAPGKNGAANTAMRFAGTPGSYVSVPYQSDLNLNNYSICAVIKPEGFYTGTCQISLIMTRGTTQATGHYQLFFSDNAFDSSCTIVDTNKYVFFASGGGSNFPYLASWQSSPPVHTQQWYCVVGTFDGSVFKIYMNGVLTATVVPPALGPIGTSNEGISIGASIFGGSAQYPYWYKGLIDDLRLYNRALSDTEISYYCAFGSNGGNHDTTNTIPGGLQQNIDLGVSPNPSTGSFELSGVLNAGSAEIEVLNMVGQRVYKNTVKPVNQYIDERIDLSNAAEGTYFIKVSAEDEIKTYRVILQR